uniref:COP9 signalosome complex subunit 3 N-terminal helical repeats domain-containing protein n=1 Tax=Salix viminalis TaxID=40686 RepID=A0A6N2LKT0_SALVM
MFRKASSGLLLLKKNVRSPSKAQVPDFSLPKHYRSRSRNEKAGAIQGSCIGPHDAHERDDILLDLLVVTTPMPSINTIAVEAFKKYILVSPIQNRLFSSSLPKYTSSAAQRNFENLVSDQDGEIHATINQKDGMVRFLEDPEQYKNSEMIERIDS